MLIFYSFRGKTNKRDTAITDGSRGQRMGDQTA